MASGVSTVLNPTALPVVFSPSAFADDRIRAPQPLVDVLTFVQSPQFYSPSSSLSGTNPDILSELSSIFVQYEIPIGLLGHLIGLRFYALHFLLDDSGSMGCSSNLQRQNASQYCAANNISRNHTLTRWQEMEDRLHVMFDLIAYVPVQGITLSFLNSPTVVQFSQKGKTPQQFKNEVHAELSRVFSMFGPSGGTPLYERMNSVINHAVSCNVPTMHYILTDGSPNGGERDIRNIERLLMNGRGYNVKQQPVSFLSCSNNPRDTEWMHESEECAVFVSAVHDFVDEQQEVYNDQGPMFPYSKGLWLLVNLVGALDPDGLDSMNQHCPFTKCVLDNLLGKVHSESEYRQYFTSHPTFTGGLISRNSYVRHIPQLFEPDYQYFVMCMVESMIPSVIYFKADLANRLRVDMESGDDNSDAIEVQRSEEGVRRVRESGRFLFEYNTLSAMIASRQNNYSASVDIAVAVPYSPSDEYAYPTKNGTSYTPTAPLFNVYDGGSRSSFMGEGGCCLLS